MLLLSHEHTHTYTTESKVKRQHTRGGEGVGELGTMKRLDEMGLGSRVMKGFTGIKVYSGGCLLCTEGRVAPMPGRVWLIIRFYV